MVRQSISDPGVFECVFANLHDFRYEGGAPINSGSQIPPVIDKKEYGPSQQARSS